MILALGVSLLLWIIPAQVNDTGSFGLPPSLAPRSLAWIMIICGLVLVLQNLKLVISERGVKFGEVLFLGACLAAAAVMLLLMYYLGEQFDRPNAGFLLAAPLGLIVLTYLHSNAPLWAYIFNAIVAPALVFIVFWWGLELPLP